MKEEPPPSGKVVRAAIERFLSLVVFSHASREHSILPGRTDTGHRKLHDFPAILVETTAA
jgi:hypothetical protein